MASKWSRSCSNGSLRDARSGMSLRLDVAVEAFISLSDMRLRSMFGQAS